MLNFNLSGFFPTPSYPGVLGGTFFCAFQSSGRLIEFLSAVVGSAIAGGAGAASLGESALLVIIFRVGSSGAAACCFVTHSF